MSDEDLHDFIEVCLTWLRGPLDMTESLHLYNFGYRSNLPLPTIALNPNSKLRLNLQSSGMQTPSRRSIVVIGRQYRDRFQDIMNIIDKIHEDTQGNPLLLFNITKIHRPSNEKFIYLAVMCKEFSSHQS